MTLAAPLITGRLQRRYKRFLADVLLDSGEHVTAHCPNTGAMTGLADAGARVWLSYSDNPKRKYALTLELVETPTGLACIHSARANALVKAGIGAGVIPALSGARDIRSEVRYGAGSRADLLLLSAFLLRLRQSPSMQVVVLGCFQIRLVSAPPSMLMSWYLSSTRRRGRR